VCAAPVAAGAPGDVTVAGTPRAGVYVENRLWVLVDRGPLRRVVEIDPSRGRATGRGVPVGGVSADRPGPIALVAAGGGLWTTDREAGTAVRIDPATAREVARVAVGGLSVGAGHAGLWALDGTSVYPGAAGGARAEHRLVRLDPVTGARITSVAVGQGLGMEPHTVLTVGRDRVDLSDGGPGGLGAVAALDGSGYRRIGGRATAFAGRVYRAVHCDVLLPRVFGATGPRLRLWSAPSSACLPLQISVGPAASAWVVYRRRGGGATLAWRRLDGSGDVQRLRLARTPSALVSAPRGVWVLGGAGPGRLTLVRGRP